MTRKLTLFAVGAFEVALILFVVGWTGAAFGQTGQVVSPTGEEETAAEKKRAEALSDVMKNLARAEAAARLTKSLTAGAGKNFTAAGVAAPKKADPPLFQKSDIHRIRKHLVSCWSPPKLKEKTTEVADIIVDFDQDGSVLEAQAADQKKLETDSDFRIFVEEAIRATFQCSPFPMPKDGYNKWKTIVFGFDAGLMYGVKW